MNRKKCPTQDPLTFQRDFFHGKTIEVGIRRGDLPCDEPRGSTGGDILKTLVVWVHIKSSFFWIF